ETLAHGDSCGGGVGRATMLARRVPLLQPGGSCEQEREGVIGAFCAIDAVMQVGWGAARVAGVANGAEYRAGHDDVTHGEAFGPVVEVGVVVAFVGGADDPDLAAAKPAFADGGDDAGGGAEHFGAARGKDVDAFV